MRDDKKDDHNEDAQQHQHRHRHQQQHQNQQQQHQKQQQQQQQQQQQARNGNFKEISATETIKNSNNNSDNKKSYKLHRKSARHGARNQDRHKELAKWLMKEFSSIQTILDVGGGGKAELASRLIMCHKIEVTVVDPRPAEVPETFINLVLPKLPKKHQQRIKKKLQDDDAFVASIVKERLRQLQIYFDGITTTNSQPLKDAIHKCDLVLGMHADGAVEWIVDICLEAGKPFVVVPCCVFPNFFPGRRLLIGSPVRTWEQFCDYLMEKGEKKGHVLERHELPFQGRNIAIVWRGNFAAI